MNSVQPLQQLDSKRFNDAAVLRKLAVAGRALAELKGVVASIPNQQILINTLGMREAKDSSAIENIVTTEDELFKDEAFPNNPGNPQAKEVLRYREALRAGYEALIEHSIITTNQIIRIQGALLRNDAGLRRLPGTVLKDGAGRVVHTPPQHYSEIAGSLTALEHFINDDALFDADPLIKMALIHHQFETIHPFYDGNGRTGRIINVLYLVQQGLLTIPVLYLSGPILAARAEYYRLLRATREEDAWEAWVIYMLGAVETASLEGIATIQGIKKVMDSTQERIRSEFGFYSLELVNNLFNHPYTKIEFIARELKVSRVTAAKYLDALAAGGILAKERHGTSNYFINRELVAALTSGAGASSR